MTGDFHVLVVDNDHALCRTLTDLLAGAGCRVECLSHGERPFAVIQERLPDLVILEVSTEAAGLETLRRLESGRFSRRVPVIVTSGQAELEYELLDVFDFLPKPLDQERLLEDIALLAAGRRREGPAPFPPLGEADLALFQDYLIRHSGLHFDHSNAKILERGLMRRMRAVKAGSYPDYLRYLEQYAEGRQELKKLLALLTVGETYFFRYLAHFEALANSVLPELIERNRGERRLRLWSAGCSSGEEPYSLAMLLLEHFPQLAGWQVEILATDINQRALRKAREGVYGARSLRVTDPGYREKYFQPLGSAFLLDPRVREMVRFDSLNLQTGAFPAAENGTAGLDVLLCRNVMIYFRLPTIRRIVERFAGCLRPGGYLFLGHAETLTGISERFQRVQFGGGFYYRRRREDEETRAAAPPRQAAAVVPGAAATAPPVSAVIRPAPPPPPAPEPEPDPAELFVRAEQAFQQEKFRAASQHYDTILRHDPRHVGALVGKGFVLANRGEYQAALELCDRALAADDLIPRAYFLRGLILELQEALPAAVTEYRKALLLDLDFVMPHYNLSKVFWRLGRLRDARRELNNTVRLLEKTPDEAAIPDSGGLSRAVFLEVCREDAAQFDRRQGPAGRSGR